MNFHSDEWIMDRVREHYNEALEYFPEDRIVGIYYQGSGNYGLDVPNSDVDTKLIVTPTLDDIIFNRKPVSTTHIRANDEHIDFKDLRLMLTTFRKQNLNFIEILFTKYKIINPLYEDLWNRLIDNNELIARYNPVAAVRTMKGIAMEKYHAMEHEYPSKVDVLAKYGYDPKQLHHLFRVEEYIERYTNGVAYADCLISEIPEHLKNVKNGCYTLGDARWMGRVAIDRITEMADKFRTDNIEKVNEEVDILLDSVQKDIMKLAIQVEMKKEETNE
jgi:predicted nucleotidyltransferase